MPRVSQILKVQILKSSNDKKVFYENPVPGSQNLPKSIAGHRIEVVTEPDFCHLLKFSNEQILKVQILKFWEFARLTICMTVGDDGASQGPRPRVRVAEVWPESGPDTPVWSTDMFFKDFSSFTNS